MEHRGYVEELFFIGDDAYYLWLRVCHRAAPACLYRNHPGKQRRCDRARFDGGMGVYICIYYAFSSLDFRDGRSFVDRLDE
jgi:hypothetical protein